MSTVFKAVTEDDILQIINGVVHFKGQPLTRQQADVLAAEAKMIQQTSLWQMLTDEMQYAAQQKMFDEARSIEDMWAGKMAIWVLDVMKKKLNSISSWSK